MKLVGLMLCRHDGWVLGLSARAALKWCDAIVILDAVPTDDSLRIISEVLKENPGRVSISSAIPGTPTTELMGIMLKEARAQGATHIVVLGSNEVLTWNLIGIKTSIFNTPPGHAISIPVMFCWKSHKYYRDDASMWSNTTVPVAFADSNEVHWHGNSETERIPRGLQLNHVHLVKSGGGGILNLENVNWSRVIAKFYLSEMEEILKRDPWKSIKKLQKIKVLDETGIKLSRVPEDWYKGYHDLFDKILLGSRSHYEEEVSRLFSENGHDRFSEINLPGEVINVSETTMSPLVVKPEAKKSAFINRTTRTGSTPPAKEVKDAFPRHSVAWSGHFLDYSGYGKANREFLFRAANTLNIVLNPAEVSSEPVLVDERTKNRVHAYFGTRPFEGSPYLRFFGPREESHRGYKICFTMMETYGTHPDLVRLLNRYDEVLVPTAWNKSVFEDSGVTSPVRTIPLGINQFIYRPGRKTELPPATLITTDKRGLRESPKGFLFVNTSNPSFRKGIDVVIKSFEDAFAGNPDVALVLCVSYSSLVHCDPFMLIPGGQKACKSKIYAFEGKMDEYQMADMYRACDAYVTASRGEGWNLPLMEASGCGLPVIAPYAFSHQEFLTEENSFLFTPDDIKVIPDAEKISPWYHGQFFADYREESMNRLTELLKLAVTDRALASKKADCLRKEIIEKYTWDIVAGQLTSRLLELSK